jgi:hypothetical protein
VYETVGHIGVICKTKLEDVRVELRPLEKKGEEGAGLEHEGEGVAVGRRCRGVKEEGMVETENLEL